MTSQPQITGYRYARREKHRQLIAELSAPKRNKFGAKRVIVDGETFDSQREAAVYQGLKLRQRAGQIVGLKRQVKFELPVNGVLIATYRADAAYFEDGHYRVVDVKSVITAKKREFVLVKKLMRAIHGIEVEVML